MKVLVTGAGAVLGQAIIKSLKLIEYNGKIELICCDPNSLAVGLFWADKKITVPFVVDPNYKLEIYKILESERPNFLFVGTDVELKFFSQEKHTILEKFNTRVVVSNEDVINIGDDKWNTYLFLKNNGFEFPNTSLSNDLEDFLITNRFPFIVKPRIGARSKDVYLVKNHKELTECLNKVHNPLIQEYLDSDIEYTAGVVYFKSVDSIASIVMKRTLRDGNTFVAEPLEYSFMNTYLENLTKVIGPEGPINFQFRIKNGKIKIFEINSRFSGTTHFRSLSNFNEVKMVLDFYMNGKLLKQPIIKNDIRILRFYEELVVNI
jgi:carbamoyl-phosphate synthase large subunit